MISGILLLTEDNMYVDDRGNLPHRPTYDKALLRTLVSLNTVTHRGYDLLPKSIQEVATISNTDPTLVLTIQEIDALADFLIIIRSARKVSGGKKFKLDKFERIAAPGQIELWNRKGK